jgi:hypothetical protein
MTTVSLVRVGEKMIVKSTSIAEYPATVDFDDILASCRIHDDNDSDAPWQNRDGYDHQTLTSEEVEFAENLHEMRGHLRYNGRFDLVVLNDPPGWYEFGYFHERGCSRQTAREMVAQSKRERLDQLVEWYDRGWESYGVTCDFRGYSSGGLWGIDDHEYAHDTIRIEEAEVVAALMETYGYTISNRPESPKLLRGMTKEGFRDQMKRNLRLDCWK